MSLIDVPFPHVMTANSGPLYPVEEVILNQVSAIETWFRSQWKKTPAPITSSVDLRHACFKLAPVDTNLFPAGFNNLNPDFMPMCIQAAQSVLANNFSGCLNLLLLPENHTRNQFYVSSLSVLRDIFSKAGFFVRIGSLDSEVTAPVELTGSKGESVLIEPIKRVGNLSLIHISEPTRPY